MSKAFKAASSIGSVALLLSSATMAAAPPGMTFDMWSTTQLVAQGEVAIELDYDLVTPANQTCPTGYECGSAIEGDGFFQRQVSHIASGNSYFQTIVTDSGTGRTAITGAPVDLTFADESFVRSGNVDGIADKQHLKDVQVSGGGVATFQNESELGTGWGAATTGSDLKLYQAIIDTKNEGFRTDFWFVQSETQANQRMKITSRVGLEGTFSNQTAYQDFVLSELKGTFAATAGNVVIPGANGGTMAWVAGEDRKSTWVGQDMASIIGQTFDYEGYDNVSTGTYDLVSAFSLAHTIIAPAYWDAAEWGDTTTNGTAPPWY